MSIEDIVREEIRTTIKQCAVELAEAQRHRRIRLHLSPAVLLGIRWAYLSKQQKQALKDAA